MEVIKGKNSQYINRQDFASLSESFDKVILDIGTGDGKFVYNNAKQDGDNFYIGLDPNRNALEKTSAKIYKKPAKGGLTNCIFIIARIEELPEELYNSVDKIYINFPWAGLLKITVEPDISVLSNIKNLCRNQDTPIELNFNYSSKYEPVEMSKLGIQDLSQEYIEDTLIPAYKQADILIKDFQSLDNEYIKNFDAQWGKKLAFGRNRTIWQIKGVIRK